MRLILTLFALLFTQLFFNLAHAAPQARVAAEQRKSHANEARPDDRRKKADKAAKAKVTAPRKTKTAKTKSEKSAKRSSAPNPRPKRRKPPRLSHPAEKGYKKAMVATAKPVWPPPNWRVKKSR